VSSFDHLVGARAARREEFAERQLWNVRAFPPQSALMPANLITLAHFSVSSAISFPNSAGDPGSATPPRSAGRAVILGSSRGALTSLLSVSMILAGVFLGAPIPYQKLASYPARTRPQSGCLAASPSASQSLPLARAVCQS